MKTSSIECNDDYVSSIVITNLKDRAITIFAVYLRLGYSYYIEVDNFEEDPLILKPFETHKKAYGPIQFYAGNRHRLDLNLLLKDRNTNKGLVIVTSDGKYVIKSDMHIWSPADDFFKNHMTTVVSPVRSLFKEKDVGGNVKSAIELVSENVAEEIALVRPKDYEIERFRNFQLTRESLESKESLDAYLREQMDKGTLVCKSHVVHDFAKRRERLNGIYSEEVIKARSIGGIEYHIVGRLLTWYTNWRLKKENARRSRDLRSG